MFILFATVANNFIYNQIAITKSPFDVWWCFENVNIMKGVGFVLWDLDDLFIYLSSGLVCTFYYSPELSEWWVSVRVSLGGGMLGAVHE